MQSRIMKIICVLVVVLRRWPTRTTQTTFPFRYNSANLVWLCCVEVLSTRPGPLTVYTKWHFKMSNQTATMSRSLMNSIWSEGCCCFVIFPQNIWSSEPHYSLMRNYIRIRVPKSFNAQQEFGDTGALKTPPTTTMSVK